MTRQAELPGVERENELARRAGKGERAAFRELVLLFQDKVAQFVRWHAASDADLEDAVSEVFVQAYRSIASYRGESSFRTWLYALSRNVCRHRLRSRRSRPEIALEDDGAELELPDGAPDHDSRLQREDAQRLVRAAVEDLPAIHREVLHLKEWEGLSYEEIAGVLDIPVGTVRSRLHNASALLLKHLSPHFERSSPEDRP